MTLDAADQASIATATTGSLFEAWARRVLNLKEGAPIDDVALRAAVQAARPGTEKKKDPFTPLVSGDRSGERVVHEDARFMLLHDRFASGIKLLAVPKGVALFLTDLSPEDRVAFEALVSKTRDALLSETGAERVDAWVNPPGGLSVRQLHAHLQPVGATAQDADAVYTKVAAALVASSPVVGPAANTEVELKFGVRTSAALDAIVAATSAVAKKTVHQTNAFFDDASGALDKARVAVRIRREQVDSATGKSTPRFELTLKGAHKADGTLTQKREEEWDLSPDAAAAALEAGCCPLTLVKGEAPRGGGTSVLIPAILALTPGATLKLVGTFTNVRKKAAAMLAGHNVVLELDATTFPSGRTDYELEVEAPDADAARAVRDGLLAIFRDADIETFTQVSKAARFFGEVRAGVAAGG